MSIIGRKTSFPKGGIVIGHGGSIAPYVVIYITDPSERVRLSPGESLNDAIHNLKRWHKNVEIITLEKIRSLGLNLDGQTVLCVHDTSVKFELAAHAVVVALTCVTCPADPNPYAEANLPDGKHMCWSCRSMGKRYKVAS